MGAIQLAHSDWADPARLAGGEGMEEVVQPAPPPMGEGNQGQGGQGRGLR